MPRLSSSAIACRTTWRFAAKRSASSSSTSLSRGRRRPRAISSSMDRTMISDLTADERASARAIMIIGWTSGVPEQSATCPFHSKARPSIQDRPVTPDTPGAVVYAVREGSRSPTILATILATITGVSPPRDNGGRSLLQTGAAPGQHGPGDEGKLVGERDREHVRVQAFLGRLDPTLEPVLLPVFQPDEQRLEGREHGRTIALADSRSGSPPGWNKTCSRARKRIGACRQCVLYRRMAGWPFVRRVRPICPRFRNEQIF